MDESALAADGDALDKAVVQTRTLLRTEVVGGNSARLCSSLEKP